MAKTNPTTTTAGHSAPCEWRARLSACRMGKDDETIRDRVVGERVGIGLNVECVLLRCRIAGRRDDDVLAIADFLFPPAASRGAISVGGEQVPEVIGALADFLPVRAGLVFVVHKSFR